MNELEQKIRAMLSADEAELLGPPGEPPLREQLKELFQGRLRWISILVLIGAVAAAVFTVVSVVYFFRAEGVQEMIAWAAGFGLGLLAVSFSRLWFWLLGHRNVVLHEVKRVELQLALLSRQLKTPR
jgi:hypothetical protein